MPSSSVIKETYNNAKQTRQVKIWRSGCSGLEKLASRSEGWPCAIV